MNLTTIRTNLAAAVKTNVTPYSANRPLRSSGVLPRGVALSYPLFYLVRVAGPGHDETAGQVVDSGFTRVTLLGRLDLGPVGQRGIENQQAELDYYLNDSDVGSIYRAVMLDNTIGGAASCVIARPWSGYESIDHNGAEHIGDEMPIDVWAI